MVDLDNLAAQDRVIIREIMQSHGFDELTKTQELAFSDEILSGDRNHLLVAETGNGKTLCAEAKVKKALDEGGSVAYLVPSTQLVRDKRDTVREWSDNYEVSSGNQKYHTADVAVATFASFYRAILNDIGNARSFDLVVLDDFHEIYGSFLGAEIEKSIAAILEEDIEIFAMSATIGNPGEIGAWLNGDVTVSPEGRQIEIKEEVIEYSGGSKKNQLAEFVSENKDKGPFLIFNFAKSWTESRAEAIADTGAFTENAVDTHVDAIESRVDGDISPRLEDLAEMISKGVAYHHSDLPRSVREYIEDLYYDGEIGCLCATTTIAYGFDAPVQSVVVADIKRRGQPVGVWEYQQWIGRAARPGYGYDVGYSYTMTKDPEMVKQQYFEPRQLEPVQTHIEDDPSFRKLVLELVATGWNTDEDLLSFCKNTLYWSQMNSMSNASMSDFGASGMLLEDKITATLEWLGQNQFTDRHRAKDRYATTDFGAGAVEFLFDTFGSHSLSSIKKFYAWLNTSEITRMELTAAVCRHFNTTLNTKGVTDKFESKLRHNGYSVSDEYITAGILEWYWAENEPTDVIDSETGVDSSYIYTTADRVVGDMEATLHLFAATTDVPAPSWFDSHLTQLQRGITFEEIALVESISGLGRYRVRNLREYLSNGSIPAVKQLDPDASLSERLHELHKNIDDDTQFMDVLKSNISGIGPATAESILEYVENTNSRTTEQNSDISDF